MRAALVSVLVLAACSSITVTPPTADVPATEHPRDAAVDAAATIDQPAALCVTGRTKACPCADGRTGAQTCGADGTYGPCACFAMDSGAGDVSDESPAPDAAPVEDIPAASAPDAAARSYDYVINRMMLDEGAEPGVTTRAFYGFNLDGRFSPSRGASQQPEDCSHGDYFSVVDPDQNSGACMAGAVGGGTGCQGGIDNQLPNLAQTIMQFQASLNVQALLNVRLNAGRDLVLIRVSGVNGALGPALNDPAVTVQLYPFVSPMFADCADVARPNQMYAIDNRSLNVPGDLDSARVQFSGSIVNGRLRVTPTDASAAAPNFLLPLPVMGDTIDLPMYRTRFRFTMGETDGTSGNLGGYASQTDLVEALITIPALRQFRDAVGPLIQGFVDVATGEPVASCASPHGGIGIGIGFSAVRAVVAPMAVSGGVPGMCGAPPATDAGAPGDVPRDVASDALDVPGDG